MSLFDRENYRWRETFFIFFHERRRPSVQEIEEAIRHTGGHFQLQDLIGDEEGRFETATVIAPDAYAAIDLVYEAGEEVVEQVEELSRELTPLVADDEERSKLKRLPQCDAKFDLLHFEQVIDDESEDALDETFDPGALLLVMEALVTLTEGVAIDPQSGSAV